MKPELEEIIKGDIRNINKVILSEHIINLRTLKKNKNIKPVNIKTFVNALLKDTYGLKIGIKEYKKINGKKRTLYHIISNIIWHEDDKDLNNNLFFYFEDIPNDIRNITNTQLLSEQKQQRKKKRNKTRVTQIQYL